MGMTSLGRFGGSDEGLRTSRRQSVRQSGLPDHARGCHDRVTALRAAVGHLAGRSAGSKPARTSLAGWWWPATFLGDNPARCGSAALAECSSSSFLRAQVGPAGRSRPRRRRLLVPPPWVRPRGGRREGRFLRWQQGISTTGTGSPRLSSGRRIRRTPLPQKKTGVMGASRRAPPSALWRATGLEDYNGGNWTRGRVSEPNPHGGDESGAKLRPSRRGKETSELGFKRNRRTIQALRDNHLMQRPSRAVAPRRICYKTGPSGTVTSSDLRKGSSTTQWSYARR